MISKRSAITAAVSAGAIALSVVPALTASAQPVARGTIVHPAPSLPVVARGLDNPRGLSFGPDGALYVAESGRGGAGPCQTGPEGGDEVCFGRSGAITRIRYGHQKRILAGLPSLAGRDGSEATGPADVVVNRRGRVSYTVGLGADPDVRKRVKRLAGMAELYEAARRGPRSVADLGAYEKRANPDRVSPPDTNPYGLTATREARYVVDAGGNTLLRVSERGRVSTVAVFRQRTIAAPAGTPGVPAGSPMTMQSVPTSVVRGPDGAWYVGELTGFPFPAGQARIYRIVPGHRPTVYATGLTNVIDLAFGPHGRLYALEISHQGLLSGDRTGALVAVNRHGSHRVVASAGLQAPGGVAIRGRDAYVTNCSVCAGAGTVVRVRL